MGVSRSNFFHGLLIVVIRERGGMGSSPNTNVIMNSILDIIAEDFQPFVETVFDLVNYPL